MVEKVLYNCYFLSRSGSHAIRDWLIEQINCVEKYQGHHHSTMIGNNFDIMIDNYERGSIRDEHENLLAKKKKRILKDDRLERDKRAIIILRDPFNLFASWSHHRVVKNFDDDKINIFVNIWKEHAKEFLGDTNYYTKKVCIGYNQWFVDEKYRKNICKQVGCRFTDKNKNKLALNGDGSSFNGRDKKFLKHADRLDVFNRWKIFNNGGDNIYEKKFIKVFKDKELISLSERIFGHIDGTEILYE